MIKDPNNGREVDLLGCFTWALIILLVSGVKYHCCHLHTSKSLSVDSVSVLLATGHIAIDCWSDRTISYLMLEMQQSRRRGGGKEREFD